MEEYMRLFETSFPVAVAAYVLIRIEPRLGELTKAITELRACIRQPERS